MFDTKQVSLQPTSQYNQLDDTALLKTVDDITKLKALVDEGVPQYFGFFDGKRSGSIGVLKKFLTEEEKIIPTIRRQYCSSRQHYVYEMYCNLEAQLKWDDRKNVAKATLSGWGNDVVWLPDHTGPTIWKMFDAKKAAEDLLKVQTVLDRDGVELAELDRVLYVNARYGGAAALNRGTIQRIVVNVSIVDNKRKSKTFVEILNDNGETSKINHPEVTVLKIQP